MKQNKSKEQLRKLIREVLSERHVDPDSATIKYRKHKDVESSTIKEPKKHEPTSATIKEKRGYTQRDLWKLLKNSKHKSIEVHVHGKDYGINDEDMLSHNTYLVALDQHGGEKEFKYKDVEFVNVDGKRV